MAEEKRKNRLTETLVAREEQKFHFREFEVPNNHSSKAVHQGVRYTNLKSKGQVQTKDILGVNTLYLILKP